MQDAVSVQEWATYVNALLAEIRNVQTYQSDVFYFLIVLNVLVLIFSAMTCMRMNELVKRMSVNENEEEVEQEQPTIIANRAAL